jgi:hypothetical protein
MDSYPRFRLPTTLQYEKKMSSPSSKSRHAMQKLLDDVTNHNCEITRTDSLPPSPHKAYILSTTEGYLMLKTSPPSGTRVMRHERKCPASEAVILRIIQRSDVPIPQLVSEDSKSSNHLGAPYLLRSYLAGDMLAAVAHRFTSYDLSQIDRTVGNYMRNATLFAMPQFGLTNKVLAGEGYTNWKDAFHALLESALRDAEDAVLTLPYPSIRYWVGIHLDKLRVVNNAHLVPLRTGSPETVIIASNRTVVVGMVGWADCVWGDPMLGEAFEDASQPFWQGFGGQQLLLYGDGYDEVRHNM